MVLLCSADCIFQSARCSRVSFLFSVKFFAIGLTLIIRSSSRNEDRAKHSVKSGGANLSQASTQCNFYQSFWIAELLD